MQQYEDLILMVQAIQNEQLIQKILMKSEAWQLKRGSILSIFKDIFKYK